MNTLHDTSVLQLSRATATDLLFAILCHFSTELSQDSSFWNSGYFNLIGLVCTLVQMMTMLSVKQICSWCAPLHPFLMLSDS